MLLSGNGLLDAISLVLLNECSKFGQWLRVWYEGMCLKLAFFLLRNMSRWVKTKTKSCLLINVMMSLNRVFFSLNCSKLVSVAFASGFHCSYSAELWKA